MNSHDLWEFLTYTLSQSPCRALMAGEIACCKGCARRLWKSLGLSRSSGIKLCCTREGLVMDNGRKNQMCWTLYTWIACIFFHITQSGIKKYNRDEVLHHLFSWKYTWCGLALHIFWSCTNVLCSIPLYIFSYLNESPKPKHASKWP